MDEKAVPANFQEVIHAASAVFIEKAKEGNSTVAGQKAVLNDLHKLLDTFLGTIGPQMNDLRDKVNAAHLELNSEEKPRPGF